MRALIVCYSYSGNTYRVAQAIQQMTQPELCQIFPSQPWRSAWALPRRTSSPTRGSSPTPPGTTPTPFRRTRSSTTPMRRKSPRTASRSWTLSITPALRAAHLPGRRARHVCVQQPEFLQRRGEKAQRGKSQCPHVGAYVCQLAQRVVWDLKSRTLQKGTRFRNLTLGDAPVGKREKNKRRGLLPGKTRREAPLLAVKRLGHLR